MIGSQLQSIRLKNFKAVRDSRDGRLTPLTVFIGNNGSGKSSLIEGLQTYQHVLRSGLDFALARWRGFENVHNPPLNFNRPARDKREKIQPIGVSLRGAAHEGGSYQTWMKIDISENGDDVLIAEERLNIRNRRILERNKQMRTYILHDRVYCARCVARKPADLMDERYGKMRPGWNERDQVAKYRCLCRDRGYNDCGQPFVDEDSINEQVVQELSHLTIPAGFLERVEQAVQSNVEHEAAFARLEELKTVVERINFSWEQGFLSPDEYTAKVSQVRREMEALRPVDYDELMEAADLVEHFSTYWDKCATVDKPEEARKQLLAKIVDRVFVYDHKVIAITLYGDFSVVLDAAKYAPQDVVQSVAKGIKKDTSSEVSACAQYGDDGVRCLLCIKSIYFRPSSAGGRCLRSNRLPNLMIVTSERKPRSVLF